MQFFIEGRPIFFIGFSDSPYFMMKVYKKLFLFPRVQVQLKGEFVNFFIGLSDVPEYDIICTEIEKLIDRFQRY